MLSSVSQNNYRVSFELFEGPLDLLLHLIKKNHMEITNIPVAIMLDEYMMYLDMIRELDIDVAGEFILMASELTHIKSRMLVPHSDEEEDEGPDPRGDLITRLKEYQKYKIAASLIGKRPLLGWDFFRKDLVAPVDKNKIDIEPDTLQVDVFHLLSAFGEVLKKAPKDRVHEVVSEKVSITEKIYQIVEQLKTQDSFLFVELFGNEQTRYGLVLTFLAILEMARLRMIRIFQAERFEPIRVQRVMEEL